MWYIIIILLYYYYVGTARLEETVNTRTRSVGRAVRCPYPDSEESDDDVVYTE